jgi:hypothetical protein
VTLPGFTAEAVLSKTTGYYRAVAVDGEMAMDSIYPALLLRGCLARCLADQNGDPFAEENCRCICYGHPGRTCWLM